ncbi:MAG: ACT domain-containing protein [Desulfococcus multivorans]|jgi:glycine cleavage system transcriptional repressor|uniref:glycine cleavage system protein R n=1 Tax=Desulfococcus sp. TaxID=2025834 RepID=UPI002A44FFBA|nr:ACT domain-containing protein [Desulfococcus multivorans]
MEKRFIMTAFGTDRPGIVADVTEVIFETGCTLENTTMTRLADEFTLILLFTGQGDELEQTLHMACRRLEREKNISAFLRVLPKRPPRIPPTGTLRKVHVEGLDQSGIVYRISRFLADHRVNIENLAASVRPSPESGADIYSMEIVVQVPDSVTLDTIDRGLDRIANDLNVDIIFR